MSKGGLFISIGYAETLLRLLAAVVVGCLFGMERSRRLKPVGIRTHVLICLACTIITMISAFGLGHHNSAGMVSDPARLMVGILTGIGFIGAGIIWKSASGSVQGITTAAEIFLLAALGIAIGLGLYFLTAIATLIGVITLESNNWLALWKRRRLPEEAAEASQEQQEDG